MNLFTEYEPAAPLKPPPKPRPVVVDPPPVSIKKRLSIWTLPEIDQAIADLDREREEQWDCLVPLGVLNAARLLPPEEMPLLADYLLGRLRDLRTRIVEGENAN